MLDPIKIMEEIARALPDLYAELSKDYARSQEIFEWLRAHQEVIETLRSGPQSIPLWEGPLDATMTIVPQEHPYAVAAADGSQIYPDKHAGVPCFVLNSGTASFRYGTGPAYVRLASAPQIITQNDDDLGVSEDVVNCRRAELELEVGLAASKEMMGLHSGVPFTFLCDGSLIFWHLTSKSPALKERFLQRYMNLLDQFYEAQVPLAGYISLPKSKELGALIKNCIALGIGPVHAHDTLSTTVDSDLVSLFLQPGQRTTVFTHNSPLAQEYPTHLVPCFMYVRVGSEIARVEVPRWVAQNDNLLATVLQIIVDQAMKGNGYPISLAEAHEQAVIKNYDREFFFSLLNKMNMSHKVLIPSSQKNLKKRIVSV
jgi:hypothetical protein